jgi:parvulin-like peptidyl-prolyl isomerase
MRSTGWAFHIVAGVAWLATLPAVADEADVIARCGEAVIRRTDLDKVVRRLGLANQAGPQRQRAEAVILEQLIDERLLRGELDRLGIRATRAEIDAGVVRLRDQVQGRGLEYEAFLAASGRTAGDVEEQVALEIALEKFVRPQITAAAVTEAFERNRRELDGTRLRVSHIVLRPEAGGDGDLAAGLLERAAAIRTEIMQGKLSFAAAARQYSAGPSRRQEGDLGWIGRDGPLVDAFAGQAYGLAKGGVSAPFVTPFGVHILTVTGVEPGRVGVEAVRPRLEKLMATQIVRSLVAEGRRQTAVTFAAGVAHLDPETAGRPVDERPVVSGEN